MRVSDAIIERAVCKLSVNHDIECYHEHYGEPVMRADPRTTAMYLAKYINQFYDTETATDDPERILAAMAHGM